MRVRLTKVELIVAGLVATMRRVSSMGNLNDQNYSTDSSFDLDIDGAASEMAFAKYMNVYYEPTVNTFKSPDVGKIQVRSTKHKTGKLIIRQRDKKNEIFVLVINENPVFTIAGWINLEDAKKDEFWFKPNNSFPPAWFVPQNKLNEMKDLNYENKSISSL